MATFRERVEAILKARDAGRFKAAMDMAAKAVEHFEKQEKHASVQSELLEQILDALQEQTQHNTLAFMAMAHSVDNLGDELRELAAEATAANVVMKKSGSNAIFLGKSWAFWKDRLSLTRSEVYTTALTIGTYLSPALIALGSSFAYAAVGGGAVAASGMASFLLGLGGIVSIAGPVVDGIKKIQKAQDQLNMAIDQYGAMSIQASRANAHLYAVIQNNGGLAVSQMLGQVQSLKDQWSTITQPGKDNFIGMMSEGVGAAQNLAPLAGSLANQIVGSLRGAWREALSDLTSGESKGILRSIGGIFSSSAGNGLRGVTNILIIFGRVIKASAPWLKRFAANWAIVTKSFRERATQEKVNKFLNEAVNHTRAWWGLLKQVARTVMLVFRGSRKEGASFVVVLTGLVTKFNDWFEMMEDTGQVNRFFQAYIYSLTEIGNALKDPMAAFDKYMPAVLAGIDKYLPKLMDAVANALAQHGPQAAWIFLKAFVDAGAWAKFLTVAVLLTKFGVFGKLGGAVAAIFVKPFIERFTAAFVAAIAVETTAGGTISAAMATAGRKSGENFGRAFTLGILAFIPVLMYEIEMKLINAIGPLKSLYESLGEGRGGFGGIWDMAKGAFNNFWKQLVPGKAAGGMIFPGQSRWVGERGPELAQATASGTMIYPGNRAIPNIPMGSMDIPDISNAIRLITNVSVQIEKREIARAVADQKAYDSARRGQEP